MALRVWLPLNGTLDNIGISDVTVTNNGATIDNNGKIGKCYSFDGTDNWIKVTIPSGMTTIKNSSIAFWGMGNRSFGGISHDGGATLATCTFYTSWQFANGNWTYVNGGTVSTTDWHHYAVTVSNDTIVTYCDGAPVTSIALASNIVTDITSSNFIEIGCDHPGGDEYGAIKVNDFRVYDHCLSPKEVKEISQGLVLHYKLDGWSGGVGENLLKNSSGVIIDKTNNTDGSRTEYFAWNVGDSYSNISATTTVTISFDLYMRVRDISSYSGQLLVYNTNNAGPVQISNAAYYFKNYYAVGDIINDRISLTTTLVPRANPTKTDNFIEFYTGYGTNNFYKISNVKIELGSSSTPYTKALADFGINTNKITDSSGYNNNGIIQGSLSTISNANRYNVSTVFTGSFTDYVYRPVLDFLKTNFTISCWGYIKALPSYRAMLVSNGGKDSISHGVDLYINSSGIPYFMIANNNTAYYASSLDALNLNTWYLFTCTYDGSVMKLYINGELKKTTNASIEPDYDTTPIAFVVGKMGHSYTNTGGYFAFNGYINDVRVYATALSADDILDLYHTPTNIDNLSNIHTFELKEQSGNMFAGSPMTGTVTWDATNNYYTITSNPSTSNWGIGPAVGTSPKKIIPWGMSYILTYEVYSPTAAQWYIDYNNNDPTTSLSGNDNDNSRLRTGVNVPANTWTLITYGCSNTNETKNPDHLPLYDYSTGLGPVMTNISEAITWHMRNPQWYLVDADNKEHIYESGVFQANFIKEDSQSQYTSFRNEEKAAWAHGYIEK